MNYIRYYCKQCGHHWTSLQKFNHCPKCLSRHLSTEEQKHVFI
jgi:predicted Zn-ribbon and HTH transcriptional regulator